MATACQGLGARTGMACLAEDLGLLIPLVFPDTGALPKGTRVMQYRADAQKNWRSINARVFDKCLIYVDVIPRYISDSDTRFALCGVPSA